MYDKGIFVFGSKIFYKETKRDAISSLPLELSWIIFSYLDNSSLRTAAHSIKTWTRIILANRVLRNRLNKFELTIKLGSASLARFYRKNKGKLKKRDGKNYLLRGECKVRATETITSKSKRGGDDLIIYKKRFKLF